MSGSGSVGMKSLAVAFPSVLRTNDYWRQKYPRMVEEEGDKVLGRLWVPKAVSGEDPFGEEMAPYLQDPFRGAQARRWLGPGETALTLEARAARDALAQAHMRPGDVELTLVSSFLPDSLGVGNAAFLAKELGLGGAAWNLESACAGPLVALHTACAYVRSGEYRSVLVVVSCTYSRVVDETETLAWTVGDAACAFVVGQVPEGEGLLGVHTLHTGQACGAMFYEIAQTEAGPRLRMRAGKTAHTLLRETAERGLRECSEGAARKAGVSLEDIDFFALPTPLAWYSRFAVRALGIRPEQTINTHPLYANTGPVLMPQNLFLAAREGLIKRGDLVMLHTVGVVSNVSAAVLRWGDVGLGPAPEPAVG